MNRIRRGYEARFRALLQQAGARRLDQGVNWLLDKAQRLSAREDLTSAQALSNVHDWLAAKRPSRKPNSRPDAIRFFCDAGLGGLARWLRASGYEARWESGIDDDVLLEGAREMSATILTTDAMLMERRLLRDGIIPAFWLPPTRRIVEQLAVVYHEFGLTVRDPRCMSCGGQLRRADKETLRGRIPPKTYLWLDEYFVCARCDKLFWHGTHWNRIVSTLNGLQG
jgi:uncharacterized protein